MVVIAPKLGYTLVRFRRFVREAEQTAGGRPCPERDEEYIKALTRGNRALSCTNQRLREASAMFEAA